jgi:hypothetical protein
MIFDKFQQQKLLYLGNQQLRQILKNLKTKIILKKNLTPIQKSLVPGRKLSTTLKAKLKKVRKASKNS